MHYHWNWRIFFDVDPTGGGTSYLSSLIAGAGWTMITGMTAWAIALLLGSLIGCARTLSSGWAVRISSAYVNLLRNIPLLVQMFLWFFVLPELLPTSWGDALKRYPHIIFLTAVISLGLFTSVRVAEQLKAGIWSLSSGQKMAALSVGMTTLQCYRFILIPQAFRIIFPPLTSELLNCIKNTSVALTIGLLELTARTRAIQEFTFQVFEPFAVATAIYLSMNLFIVRFMGFLERRVAVPGLTMTSAIELPVKKA